jgi:hypothetical protein
VKRCKFCGIRADQVRVLLEVHGKHLCGECLGLFNRALAAREERLLQDSPFIPDYDKPLTPEDCYRPECPRPPVKLQIVKRRARQ